MSIPFLGRVPLTLAIRRMSDAGTPPAAGEGAEAEPFLRIAERLDQALNQRRL
jgi:ATP-binding protein involved in chromosome partitioning